MKFSNIAKAIVIGCALLLATSGATRAQQDEITALHAAAETGDVTAEFTLANHYYRGLGVPQDFAKARALYERAAERGLPEADNRLGMMYERGLGVSQSYGRAMTSYRKAAVKGNALAQYNLGMLYETGKGGRQDYAQALGCSAKRRSRKSPKPKKRSATFTNEAF